MLASRGEDSSGQTPGWWQEAIVPNSTPHLLLEQGLDGVFPVPDALAQLCLLDKLLGGGNEEFLQDSGFSLHV